MKKKIFFGALMYAMASMPMLAVAAPDAIYLNGKVITVDDNFSIASAFAVEGDRFSAVGNEEIRELADDATRIIDLGGRTVIPGLIDNHNHFIRGAQHWNSSLRLDGVGTRAEALERLKSYAAGLAQNEWLLVLGGWHEEQFTDDPTGFSREELDAIADDRPAFLQVQYAHAYVNTAFLKLIGAEIQADPETEAQPPTPSALDRIFGPPLPELVERDENGTATSRLNGGMGMVIQTSTIMPELSYDEVTDGTLNAQAHYNAMGLTTVYDPGGALPTRESYQAVEDLHTSDQLTLRVFRTAVDDTLDVATVKQLLARLRPLPDWLSDIVLWWMRDEESTAGTIDFINNLAPLNTGDDFHDVLAVGEVFYLPLHDSMDDFTDYREVTDRALSEVRALMIEVVERAIPAQIHAVDGRTIEIYLDLIDELTQEHAPKPNQFTITHGEGVTPAQLQRMKLLNIGLQIRSMPVVRSRNSIVHDYTQRALSMPPLRDIASSGIYWGLGTDGTKAAQINPWRTLHWAVTGKAINGDLILETGQTLSREEALIAHTKGNAYLVGRENRLGQIRTGYLADFVVLDKDYLTIDSEQIMDIKPRMTVVAGKAVYEASDDRQ